jgi:4-amino-4-deoxy-L-arabinose transferase-like glycosyltransferase
MSTAEMTSELTTLPREGELTSPGPYGTKLHLRKYIPYLTFAFCASLYLFPFMRLLLQDTNEGTFVNGAVRTVHGQLLGREFFEVMGPGTFYWLALFFKLFGVTFLASRICLFVTSLGTALSLYFLSRRVCRSYQSLPCIFVFATYFGARWPTINHHVDSNCFALLAVVCMLRWYDSRRSWLLVAAGALAGATTLTVQPKGLLLLLAVLVWLLILHRRHSTSFTALVWVAGGCASVVALMLGYFRSQNALGDLIYANVVWPSRNYGAVNSVHYAFRLRELFDHWIVPGHGINWTVGMASVLVIPFLVVAALPLLVVVLGARDGVKAMRMEIVLYWLAGSALWFSELHRKDVAHLVYGSPLLIILCIFYLERWRSKASGLALQVLSIASVCLAGCTLLLALLTRPTMTRAGQVSLSKPDPVLTAIDEHVPSGGNLFIYPYSPMYYFLSKTNNPTRYSFLVYNYYTPAQFEEAIRSLEQHKVKYVLWDKHFQSDIIDVLFPNAHPKQLIMEPYLESHYRPVWIKNGVLLMERNEDDSHPTAVEMRKSSHAPIRSSNDPFQAAQ